MFSRTFRTVAWLVAAVYLLDGVLAGAAHVHGPLEGACCPTVAASEETHSHHGCSHGHRHAPAEKTTVSHEQAPVAPQHEHCTACRYSSLSARPIALVILPALTTEVEFVAPAAPVRRAVKIVSRCRSRAPPAVA